MEKLVIEKTGGVYDPHSYGGYTPVNEENVRKNKATVEKYLSEIISLAGYTPLKTTDDQGYTYVYIKEFGGLHSISATHETRFIDGRTVKQFSFIINARGFYEYFSSADKLLASLPVLLNKHGGKHATLAKNDARKVNNTK